MYLDTGHHLSYCTNIHPGETWAEVFQQLKTYLPPLKQKLSPERPFGIGLRLSNLASEELLQGNQLQEFRQWLQEQDLYVFTMNGFPYGGFHHQAVKDDVHKPDWTTQERLEYTKRLAHILAELLPEGMEGGISTSPLSYKLWFPKEETSKIKSAFSTATDHLVSLVETLLQLKADTSKTIHIDIEPEPDGLLENSDEFISYYREWLLPAAEKALSESRGLSKEEARTAVLQHIQLCYDVCHFALAYEKPAEVFAKIRKAGISIGKIQLSAALKTDLPKDVEMRGELAGTLARFAESTYLHQVVERGDDGKLTQYPDLPLALEHIRKPNAVEWRTHFHVPLFTQTYSGLASTQQDIVEVLQYIQQEPLTQHLEVETYTWDVLPEDMKKELSESIQRELEWVLSTINATEHAENGRTGHRRAHTATPR
ncbi:metabolite traffic protein EboE [Pontibacter russatus]|uniref:metabolite traffic protein EboE n=1 Tax=Pontibacter russatus TaxID=2694929 RepID=UPI00137B8E9E|nr:metabolite traffic protein EboE [Pontibacter russatus]